MSEVGSRKFDIVKQIRRAKLSTPMSSHCSYADFSKVNLNSSEQRNKIMKLNAFVVGIVIILIHYSN